ncbi:hypothetical protein C4J83_3549 [Pseudomonas sp. LBUM920]|nr:hypothetical protein C4J83_3549 [Pseudomonas sp. LBUM920]
MTVSLLGAGLPLSQASQLPHFLPCSGGGFCVSKSSNVGAGLGHAVPAAFCG